MMKDHELKAIMHALTLRDRGPKKRSAWLSKGFRKFHARGETALFDYWRKRIDERPRDAALAATVLDEYLKYRSRRALPPIGTQLANFAGAIVAEGKAIAAGKEPVTEEEKIRRLSICLSPCPSLLGKTDDTNRRCAECGCYINHKIAWRSQKCPIGKW